MGRTTIPLQHPFMLTMCGPTQCGKTHLMVKIIDNIDNVIEPVPDKLLYLYTAEQTGYDDIKQIVRKNALYNTMHNNIMAQIQ